MSAKEITATGLLLAGALLVLGCEPRERYDDPGSTTVSREVDSLEVALKWLASPPAVEVPLPKGRRDAFLRVRVRAVFSSGTTWLVFPSSEGTDWVEVKLEAPRDEE